MGSSLSPGLGWVHVSLSTVPPFASVLMSLLSTTLARDQLGRI